MIRLLEVFGVATLQGLPAPGRRRFGVPVGGAFDLASHVRANTEVGNPPGALTLELGLCALSAAIESDCELSISGGEGEVQLDGHRVEGRIVCRAGQKVVIAPPRLGARRYLAVRGGWAGKASLPGERLTAGAHLPFAKRPAEKAVPFQVPAISGVARFVPSPSAPTAALEAICGKEWTVSPLSDRAGVRLSGPKIDPLPEIESIPTQVGTIQVFRDGSPLVIGPDGPTIGGYAHAGTILQADLGEIAQARPGATLTLKAIDLTAARAITRRWRASLALSNPILDD